jgi:hypothetical protein
METTKNPSKFILALRKYRLHKQQWQKEVDSKLAAEEEELKKKRNYLYHDIELA